MTRLDIYDALCHLTEGQFVDVLARSGAPQHELAPALAPRTVRASDLVQWAEGVVYEKLVALVRKAAPARLP